MEKKQKKLFGILPGILLGIILGLFVSFLLEKTDSDPVMVFLLGMVALIFSLILQTMIHEGGHLLFGLLSGYEFTSYRIFGWMLMKDAEGRLHLRRFTVAGTDGQCLLSPPDLKDGKIPVLLYNLGGSLMNLMTALAALLGCAFLPEGSFWWGCLLLFALTGFGLALLNGIPMRIGPIDNDGRNALSLRRDPAAMYAFWLQMKGNARLAAGERLRDMPEEWFYMPEDEKMTCGLVAAQGVLVCNRLMDQHRFREAEELMEHMQQQPGLIDLHRRMLTCDQMYVEMISQNRRELVDGMRTKQQLALMKKMKNNPSVMRTEYAYALLCKGDKAQGDKIRKQFEQISKTYPYPADIRSEQELMDIAREAAK